MVLNMSLAKQLLVRSSLKKFWRMYSSALYITGDKAHNTFAVLTPVLDFEERLQNKSELEENLKFRHSNIDLERLERQWNFYKHFDEQKIILEVTKSVIGKEIARLMKDEEKNAKDLEKLRLHGKLVKEDLRVLRDYLYGIEELAALNVLSLPNVLHEKTPREEEVVVHSFLEKPTEKSKFHLDIGVAKNLVEYTNPLFYYLKGDAALFELSVNDYISNILLNSSFTQFSNSDFCRSVVVEGCSTDFLNKLQVFTLEEIHSDANHEFSRLHLTGGASLYSFMAYFTRNSVLPVYFPLKLFASGRKYQPATSNDPSLFNVSQETALEIFVATKDDHQELYNEFQKLVLEIIKIYEPLGQHFRLVYLPASKLMKYESLRLSIQMFSSHLQRYVEVGHCSICDSYLSKRLLFTYSVNKERNFPKVISGSLLRVQPLLACMLEYSSLNKSADLLPSVLKNYVLLDSV